MLLLNFAHPLTDEQLWQVEELVGLSPNVRQIPVQSDRRRPIADVARDLADATGLTTNEWQTLPLLVNPPGLVPLALTLFAELHGRCGYFVPILNMRPVPDAQPRRYEVAEIVNLQAMRDSARTRR